MWYFGVFYCPFAKRNHRKSIQSKHLCYQLCCSAVSDQPEANLYYKKLWGGFFDSPEFSQFTLSGPIKSKNIGLGLNTAYQQIGLFSYLTAQGSFSYKVKLNDANFLSFGIQAGVKRLQINFNKINAQDPDELMDFPDHQASTLPTADVSAAYKHKGLLVFAGANQLLSGNFKYHDATFQPTLKSRLIPNYLMGMKWEQAVSKSFSNTLYAVARTHQGLPLQLEVSDMLTWQQKFSIGVGYRQTYSAFAMLRVQLSPSLAVGYSYEYAVKALNKYTGGGHEINLCYQFSKGTKESESQKKLSNNNINGLYDELDTLHKKLDDNANLMDSLNQQLTQLRIELNKLKPKTADQKSNEQLKDVLDSSRVLVIAKDGKGDGYESEYEGNYEGEYEGETEYSDENDAAENQERMDSLDRNMQQLRAEFKLVQQQNLDQTVEKNTTDIDSLNKNVGVLRVDVNKLQIQFEKLEVVKTYIDSVKDADAKNNVGAKTKNVRKSTYTAKKKQSRLQRLFKKNKPAKRPVSAVRRKPKAVVKKTPNTIGSDSLSSTERGKNLFHIECLIKDRKTLKPVNAEITVVSGDTENETNLKENSDGNWSISIQPDEKYTLSFSAIGYASKEVDIDSKKEKSLVVLMEPLKVGDNFIMKSIYFHPNSYALKKESEPELKRLVVYLTNNPGINIEIQGHTNGDKRIRKSSKTKDRGAEWNFNGSTKKLSANRAEVIKKYLIDNGVSAERLKTKGLGGSKPIVKDPETMSEGQKNIRVEIVIKKN